MQYLLPVLPDYDWYISHFFKLGLQDQQSELILSNQRLPYNLTNHNFNSLILIFFFLFLQCSVMKVSQSGPILCKPWTVAFRPFCPWNSPGQNTEAGSGSLLQGIFTTQELNQHLLCCRQILHQLSYQGSPLSVLTS